MSCPGSCFSCGDSSCSSASENNKEYEIIVDQNICIGCGVCEALCPHIFEVSSEDRKSHVKANANHNDPLARDAESACPVNSIHITEKE
jgi:ferredoxin